VAPLAAEVAVEDPSAARRLHAGRQPGPRLSPRLCAFDAFGGRERVALRLADAGLDGGEVPNDLHDGAVRAEKPGVGDPPQPGFSAGILGRMKTAIGSGLMWLERILMLLGAALCLGLGGALVAWLVVADWQILTT
jgi:hypothetical protein